MAKINLLNRIQKRQVQKRKVAVAQNAVWIITTEMNDREYYVQSSYDRYKRTTFKEGNAIVWTPNRSSAMKFHTETGCHHFVHQYMNNRNDIQLRCIEE